VGLVLIFFGLFQYVGNQKKGEVKLEEAVSPTKNMEEQVVVDVEGAVIKPGVYKLGPESRFLDALAAAGGLSDEADRDYVEKNINLAKKVSDGLKIYVPRVGEEILSSSGLSGSSASSTININTASTGDLESLPGIGAVTAQKIITGRPYSSIDDLLNRKIVGQSTFDKIKEKISAN